MIMGKGNNDFDDFLMFSTIKGGGCGGCLISALSIVGAVIMLAVLII